MDFSVAFERNTFGFGLKISLCSVYMGFRAWDMGRTKK
jgi:hypothetical protein